MSKRRFTQEEIEDLQASPYVLKVTEGLIAFTPVFWERVVERQDKGESSREILEKLGFSVETFGETRVAGIMGRARTRSTTKENHEGKPKKKESGYDTRELRIAKLEHEVEFLRQQMMYLKKIADAEKEAERVLAKKRKRTSDSK